jgi:hypothetical protein
VLRVAGSVAGLGTELDLKPVIEPGFGRALGRVLESSRHSGLRPAVDPSAQSITR